MQNLLPCTNGDAQFQSLSADADWLLAYTKPRQALQAQEQLQR